MYKPRINRISSTTENIYIISAQIVKFKLTLAHTNRVGNLQVTAVFPSAAQNERNNRFRIYSMNAALRLPYQRHDRLHERVPI